MSDPIITYVEFDDNQAKGQPAKTLSYAEWEPLNDDDSGSGYGSPRDDQEPIPDEVRVALAKIVLPGRYEIATPPARAAVFSALEAARLFISDELDARRESGFHETNEYLKTPADVLARIEAALTHAEV